MRGTRPTALDTISVTDPRKFLAHAGLATNCNKRIGAREALIRDLRKRDIGDKPNARRGRKGSRLRRCDLDAIHLPRLLVVGAREHLQRSGDVEQLAIGKREQQNAMRPEHQLTLAAAPFGPKAILQSI